MLFIVVTLAVFHALTSPLKVPALRNILARVMTLLRSGESLAVIVASLLQPQKYPPLPPSCTLPHCATSTSLILLPLFRNANPVRLPVTVTVYVPAVAYVWEAVLVVCVVTPVSSPHPTIKSYIPVDVRGRAMASYAEVVFQTVMNAVVGLEVGAAVGPGVGTEVGGGVGVSVGYCVVGTDVVVEVGVEVEGYRVVGHPQGSSVPWQTYRHANRITR
jgi:hypothetical protein